MIPTKTLLLPGFLNPPSLPGDFFWLHENNTIDVDTVWHYTKNMDTTKLEYKMARRQTNYLLELIDSGMLSADDVVTMALKYMSEDEVADMMRVNDILVEDDEEFGDYDAQAAEWHDSVSESQEWHDYDPDC